MLEMKEAVYQSNIEHNHDPAVQVPAKPRMSLGMKDQSSNNADDENRPVASSTSQDDKEQPQSISTSTDSTSTSPTANADQAADEQQTDESSSGSSVAGQSDSNADQSDSAQPSTELPSGRSAKNPAAVSLGRLGGLKGGKARAQRLTKKERSEAARKAASARWQKRKQEK